MGRVNQGMKAALARRNRDKERIAAVRRPPQGATLEDVPPVPYVIEDDEFHLALFRHVAGHDNGASLQDRIAEGADPEMTELLVHFLGRQQERLFNGVHDGSAANALFPIEAFLAHHHVGLYPPEWVLEWLYGAFEAYVGSAGTADMAKLLGTKRGKGQTPIQKEFERLQTEGHLMHEIGVLTLLGISIADAAYMVHGRLEAAGFPCQSAETLAEIYSRRQWSELTVSRKPLQADHREALLRQVKAAYPEHTIPHSIK